MATTTPIRLTVLISGNGTNLQALIDATTNPTNNVPTTTATHLHLPSTTIVRVISNRKAAYGLQRAQAVGIPTSYHNIVPYRRRHYPAQPQGQQNVAAAAAVTTTTTTIETKEAAAAAEKEARAAYDLDLARLVLSDDPDLIICAGWMHVLSSAFLDPVQDAAVAIVNLHPARPGEYDGCTDAIARAYRAFTLSLSSSSSLVEAAPATTTTTTTGVMLHHVVSDVDRGKVVLMKDVDLRETESFEDFESRMHQVEWIVIVQGTGMVIESIRERRDREKRGRREGQG